MAEILKAITHLRICAGEPNIVYLDDGEEIQVERGVKFDGSRIGLVTKDEHGQLMLADIVKPATPGIMSFMEKVTIANLDSEAPFLIPARHLRIIPKLPV